MNARPPRFETLETRRLLSAGDVDLTFGVNGEVTLTNPPNGLPFQPLMVSQSGGKVLLAEHSDLERFNADGSVDTTFGASGHVTPAHNIYDMKIAPDGKIVILIGENQQSVNRYNADGSPDTSFGAGGSHSVFNADHIAIQSDGRIIVSNMGTLHRLNADGSDDSTFTSVAVMDDHPQQAVYQLIRIAVDANDRILLGFDVDGYRQPYLSINGDYFTLARFNANGTLDTTFCINGFYRASAVNELMVLSDGKVAISGKRVSDSRTVLLRFNSSGVIDGYLATSSSGLHATATPDGKYLLYGAYEIDRLNADGTPDNAFARVITSGWKNEFVSGMETKLVLPLAGGAAMAITISNATRTPHLYRLGGDHSPAGPVSLSNGTLTITGTSADDMVDVQALSTNLFVRVANGLGRVFNEADVSAISIDAAAGNDNVWIRAAHNATLIGGDGNDTLRGGEGDDSISGGEGADLINAGNGNDSITGDGGKDSIYGSAGDDTLFGGAGADRLSGGDGNDSVEGQGGNDRISGGDGADTLHGGAGSDVFFTSLDSAIDQITGDRGEDSALCDATDLLLGIEHSLS